MLVSTAASCVGLGERSQSTVMHRVVNCALADLSCQTADTAEIFALILLVTIASMSEHLVKYTAC